MSDRVFTATPAVRESVPLLVGLNGPSGSGKTYSALRLATGIQRVRGGDIYVLDTESKRALHYADQFKFHHVPFGAPFGSLDYLEALKWCVSKGAGAVITDSMSHEHEGPGGYLQSQEVELQRMAGDDYAKRERAKMAAWIKPSGNRRQLINGLLQLNSNFIFCFRAKEKVKPVKVDGKTEIVDMGWSPIAGDEFAFEMTLMALLLPGSKGVPTWNAARPAERQMTKLPGQFTHLFQDGRALDEAMGQSLAEWAKGGGGRLDELRKVGKAESAKGSGALKAWWESLPGADQKALKADKDSAWKEAAKAADKAQAKPQADQAGGAAEGGAKKGGELY